MSDDHSGAPSTVAQRVRVERTEAELHDRKYREGVIALLGALAYGELKGFSTIVFDADHAPTIQEKIALSRIAIAEFHHYDLLVARIGELGGDAEAAMAVFAPTLDEWHRRTQPAGWLEGLMKVYAGSAMATDFYRECANVVDPGTRRLVQQVVDDSAHAAFVESELRAAIAQDPRVASRLALWGRRIVGEALTQAQHAAGQSDELAGLIIDDGSGHGFDLQDFSDMLTRLTDAHTARMGALGLSA